MFRKCLFLAIALLALSLSVGRAGEAVPIALRDGLVWADVICNGRNLHFVVDTGAGCSCVNLAAARQVGLRLGDPVNVAGVGGRAIGYRCEGFVGNAGEMPLPREVLALDLSGPARACSRPIDGLIGADFFQGNVVRIDYARRLLERINMPAGGAAVKLRFAGGVMCVPVAVDGSRPRWARLDTGCTDALVWCFSAAANSRIGGRSVALASSASDGIPADVTVGAIGMRAVPVKFRDREVFPGEAGLLGNAALSKCRAITVDGIRKRLYVSL